MLAGVQDQQQLTAPERVDQRRGGGPVGLLADAEHGRHLPRGQRRVGAVGQLDQPDAVGEVVSQLPAEPGGEPGLADAAGPAQGQRAHVAEQQRQVAKVALAADEAVRLRG